MPHMVGNVYTNAQLNEETGCSIMGGIRVAHSTRSIVLVHVPGSVYNDRIDPADSRIFLYTGQGLEGDQELTRGNLALSNVNITDVTIHFYIKERPNEYRYQGEYQLVGDVFEEEQLDQNGDLRNVFMFPITAV